MEDGLEVSLEDGLKRFHLNGTAKTVWELTIRPISLDEIAKNISTAYEQPFSLARNEVLEFLDDATRYGLISQLISEPEIPDPIIE